MRRVPLRAVDIQLVKHLTVQTLGDACPKCGGLMVLERLADLFIVQQERRCLCCGNIRSVSIRHIRATDQRPLAGEANKKWIRHQ